MGFTFSRNVSFDEKDILSQVSSSANGVFGLYCGNVCLFIDSGMIQAKVLNILRGNEPDLDRCFDNHHLRPTLITYEVIRDWTETERRKNELKAEVNALCY